MDRFGEDKYYSGRDHVAVWEETLLSWESMRQCRLAWVGWDECSSVAEKERSLKLPHVSQTLKILQPDFGRFKSGVTYAGGDLRPTPYLWPLTMQESNRVIFFLRFFFFFYIDKQTHKGTFWFSPWIWIWFDLIYSNYFLSWWICSHG